MLTRCLSGVEKIKSVLLDVSQDERSGTGTHVIVDWLSSFPSLERLMVVEDRCVSDDDILVEPIDPEHMSQWLTAKVETM